MAAGASFGWQANLRLTEPGLSSGLVLPEKRMRLVRHLDVDAQGVDRVLAAFGSFVPEVT